MRDVVRMTRSEDFDATIVARYLSGESTPAESALVEAWIASDPVKRAEFDEVRRGWAASFPLERSIDVDSAWARVSERMHELERSAPKGVEQPLVLHVSAPRSSVVHELRPGGSETPGRHAFRLTRGEKSIGLRVAAAAVILLGAASMYPRVATRFQVRELPARTTREFAAAPGQRALIDLDDGTHIVLAPSSHLKMSMPVGGSGLREAVLNGEAMFTVTHDSARPFVVRSRYGNTVDIGTAFAVRAYANEAYRVSVREGRVALEQPGSAATPRRVGHEARILLDPNASILIAGDVATGDAAGKMTITHGQDVAASLDWTSGRLTFDHKPFGELVPDLERWYGVDIRIEGRVLRTRSVTGQFDTESKYEAFNALGRVLGAQHRIDGNRVTFYLR